MASIAIHDLQPAGYSLFADSESYLVAMSSEEGLGTLGGGPTTILISSTLACGIASFIGSLIFTLVAIP